MATVATLADNTIVGDNEDQLVTMIVDDQLFGIPILQVQDIVEASKITPVPLAPSAIAGVLNLRGRIVTVVDLRKLLGNHSEVPWESQMGVTVDYKGDLYTLLVDAIGDVRTLPKHDFDKAPSTMEENVRRLCLGIYRLRGNLLVVLDVARILRTDIIEATPMLTVEERRNRKAEAVAQSDTPAAKGHQLSALMTDLNAYESEVEGVFGAVSDSVGDDIKARKRASRHRRPIADRWKEVLEEKARKSGNATYRMREPDEETIENARSEMAEEDAEWAARVIGPEHHPSDGRYEESTSSTAAEDLPPPTEVAPEAPDLPDEQQPDPWSSENAPGDFAPDMPASEPGAGGKKPLDLRYAPDSATDASNEELAPSSDSGMTPDQPATDQTAASAMTWDSDAVADLPAEQPSTDAGEGPPVESAPEETEAPADELQADVSASAPRDGEAAPSESVGREIGGIASDWWNKLRAKTAGSSAGPDTVDAPAEDGNADQPKPVKHEQKAKSTKKTGSKSKRTSKAGAKSKAASRSKKKT